MCIYARPSHRPILEPELEWATPQGRGFDAMRRQEAARTTGKGKGRVLGDTGVGGSGGGIDDGMQKILDGLVRVNEDEKAADGVMVSATRLRELTARRRSQRVWT